MLHHVKELQSLYVLCAVTCFPMFLASLEPVNTVLFHLIVFVLDLVSSCSKLTYNCTTSLQNTLILLSDLLWPVHHLEPSHPILPLLPLLPNQWHPCKRLCLLIDWNLLLVLLLVSSASMPVILSVAL